MMMPANFSAVAENEMTYVVGGSLVDVLAPAMTTANWQNVSTNVIKIIGNSFLANYTGEILGELFNGYYVPGDVIGYSVKKLDKAYKNGYSTFGGNWGFAVGALNVGMQVLGGLSAIYTLGSSPIGLEVKSAGLPSLTPAASTTSND